MIDVILFAMSVVTLWQVSTLRRLIYDTTYNNVKELMTDEMYEVFDRLDDTEPSNAMRSYFRKQLDDVYARYLEAKRFGMERLKNENFRKDLLGSTEKDLRKDFNFTDSYCDKVRLIIEHSVDKFGDRMIRDMGSRLNYRKSLKKNTVDFYRITINRIYDTYIRYSSNITEVMRSEEGIGILVFGDTVSVDKIKTKNEISAGRVGEVLDILSSLPHLDNSVRNGLILIMARYADYEDRRMKGFEVEKTELPAIISGLLTWVDKL